MPIDPATGDLVLPLGRLERTTGRRSFTRGPWFAQARPLVDNPPWMSWQIDGGQDGEDLIGVQLYFEGDTLRLVNMVHSRVPPGATWDDWSEDGEVDTKTRHDALLRDWFGEPTELHELPVPTFSPALRYLFPWGEVWSSYDPKGMASSISIQYS